MKAVLLTGYGDVDKLEYGDVPDPTPRDGEVLVKVVSTSVNPLDFKLRKGYLKDHMPLQFPMILGSDAAGEVVEAGADVRDLKPGDKVMGSVTRGYAELLAAKAGILAKVPAGLDLAEAGVIPLVTLTGTQLIEKGLQPKAGDTVLVTGAVGPVGRTAVYIAKAHGAVVIAGVRASQRKEAQLLGADKVIALDSPEEMEALPPLDGIADAVGGKVIEALLPKMKQGGVIATVLGVPPAGAEEAGVRVALVFSQPDAKRLAELAEDVLAGDLTIPIAKRFKLSEIREAHRAAEKGVSGKILLTP